MTPEQKQIKIRSLLARLDALEGGPVGREVSSLIAQEGEYARSLATASPTSKAVKLLNEEIIAIKKDPRLKQLSVSIEEAKNDNEEMLIGIVTEFSDALNQLQTELQRVESSGGENMSVQTKAILGKLSSLSEKFDTDYTVIAGKSASLEKELANIREQVRGVSSNIVNETKTVKQSVEISNKTLNELRKWVGDTVSTQQDAILGMETRLLSRINSHGSGNMNRNIAIGGNQSVLNQFNDINFKAGNNVTLSYATNQATGFVDVTIAATGGGGSVGGVTRSINTINTSQTAGSVIGTDYVYIASAGVALTLPSASGNENLYTIKNTGVSSVLVAPDGADTIDTDANVILATQYTSIDLISDGVSNWNIT